MKQEKHDFGLVWLLWACSIPLSLSPSNTHAKDDDDDVVVVKYGEIMYLCVV